MNKYRLIVLLIPVFALFTGIIWKLVKIQIIESEELSYKAQKQQMTVQKISPERGKIFDRDGILLVYSKQEFSVSIDINMAKSFEKDSIISRLSKLTGNSIQSYNSLLNNKKGTIVLERKLSAELTNEIRKIRYSCLKIEENPTRVYQYDNFASHVLGFVNKDYVGVTGIENIFDEKLKGIEGSRLVLKSPGGNIISIVDEETKAAIPGVDIVLTINKKYQDILEEKLRKGLESYQAESGIGIIIDPNNGEILAFSNMNDFNPNEYWNAETAARRNLALTDTYEPGSTFKAFSFAALLDKNLTFEDEVVDVEFGKYKFRNVYIRDSHPHQTLSVRGVFEQSSNVGTAKLIMRMNDDEFYKYLRSFGFGNVTSIQLPGEAKGLLKKPSQWSALTKPFMSYGYEVSVTPIQMVMAYAALINGGNLFEPMLIKKISDRNGKTEFIKPKLIRNVISQKTSDRMKELFTGVVEKGTAKVVKIDKVSVGGKTGTSQKFVDGAYSKQKYNTSFIGFFPAENPKLLCLILVNSPKVGKYGGLVAAPIFKEIASEIINKEPHNFYIPSEKIENENEENNIKFASASDVYRNNGNVPTVKSQTTEQKNNKVIINNKNIMPDLTNYSLREAISVLNEMGIKYKVEGTGRIIAQNIKPGEKINDNKTVILKCEEHKIEGLTIY